MRSKLILTCAMVAVLLSLFACSSASEEAPAGQVSVEASCDDFMKLKHISKEAEVTAGDSFTVTLCSNPTTGYGWSESAQIGDQAIVQQIDHGFVILERETPPQPGAPGEEVWTFKALKEGTSRISMEYSRPWEGGEKASWTFELTVVVK